MSDVYLGNRYPNIYLKLTGGELSGPISTHGIKISSAVDYGTTLPETGTEGQLFFQLSDPYYELPIGGTTGQVLSKRSNTDRDVQWSNLIINQLGTNTIGDFSTPIYLNAGVPTVCYHPDHGAWYRGIPQVKSDGVIEIGKYIDFHAANTDTTIDYDFRFTAEPNELHCSGALYGAVWNDYAEYRKDNPKEKDCQQPGRCVREVGDGTLALTTKRLECGCEIISDTFGFAIGQDKENGYDTPIASNGRVLAYPYESIEEFSSHIGWPVCSGPNGTVSIMTEEEEKKYPSRIIGTISEIPTYDTWGSGNIEVNSRIWIRIR